MVVTAVRAQERQVRSERVERISKHASFRFFLVGNS